MKSLLVLTASALATSLVFAQDPTALVKKVQGNVIYTDATGSESVGEGKRLPAKGSLATTAQASATVKFNDTCEVTLGSGQRLDLAAAETCDGLLAAIVNLPTGALGAGGVVAGGAGSVGVGTVIVGLAAAGGTVALINRNRRNSSPN